MFSSPTAVKTAAIWERFFKDPGAKQKHVWHARIILVSANGCGTMETVKELDFESRGFGRSDNYFAV